MEDFVSIISTTGFPIAMCLIIMYYWQTQYKSTIESLQETVSQLTSVVSDNTKTIALLQQSIVKE